MSTPTAILLAGAMLALALFFGLRGLSPAPAAPPAAPPEPPALASAPPSPPPVDLAVARQHAANALAYHRGALRQSCYLPAVAGEAAPPRISFTFNLTFDPEGLQIARGVVETRGEARQAITRCVLAQLPPLRIPRPGQVVTADLSLSFP